MLVGLKSGPRGVPAEPASPARRPPLKEHGLAAGVALAVAAIGLAGGGYDTSVQAIAAIAIWWLVILGLFFGWWPRGLIPGAALLAGSALAAMTLLSALSIGPSAHNGEAFEELVQLALYLGAFVLVVLASPRGRPRQWLAGVAAGLVAVAAVGLLSRFQSELFPDQREFVSLTASRSRLSYPFGYWNGLAAAMAIAAVLLTWLAATAASRRARTAAVAAMPLVGLALLLTSSRGGLLALAVGVAVLLLAGPARLAAIANLALGALATALLFALALSSKEFIDGVLDSPQRLVQGDRLMLATLAVVAILAVVRSLADARFEALAAVRVPVGKRMQRGAWAVAAGAAVAAAALLGPPALERFTRSPEAIALPGFVGTHLTSASGSGRAQFWGTALDAFAERPLTGIGAGGYGPYWAQHGSLPLTIQNAHSLPLETLAELGLLGLAALLAFVAVPVAAAWRRRWTPAGVSAAAPVLAVLAATVVAFALDWVWELPGAFLPFVIAAGLATGPALAGGDPERPRSRLGWGVAVAVAAWAAILVSAVALLSEVKLGDSREAAARGDLARAAADAREAAVVQPWAPDPPLQLGLVQESAGDLTGARRSLGRAIDRAPADWRLWLIAARIDRAAGDTPAALRAFARAKELNPRGAVFTE